LETAASNILFSFASSESEREVKTIGAEAPRITAANLELAK